MKLSKFICKRWLYLLVLAVFIFPTVCCSVNADTSDLNLAYQYAPIFYFESNENFYPVDVNYMIENSNFKVYDDPLYNIVLKDLTDEDFKQYSDIFKSLTYGYFDNNLGSPDDPTGIITDYQNKLDDLGYTVYFRVFEASGLKYIQYWLFYAFNQGDLNSHEGDWEMVQITLNGLVPESVSYSQHYEGQRISWSLAEKDESDHVKVYVARGSHANFPRSYHGKFSLSSDTVGNNGKILNPQDYTLEELQDQIWLNFSGYWGEFAQWEDLVMGRVGPKGPMYREKIPMGSIKLWDGETYAASLSETGMGYIPIDWSLHDTLNWLLYNFIPIYMIITLAILALIGLKIFYRYKKRGLGKRIISMLYIDGPNLNTIGNILCIVGIILAIIAIFQPWYTISYAITGDESLGGFAGDGTMIDMLSIDGASGIEIVLPMSAGPTPFGTFSLPFGVFILIGIVLTILATVGIYKSSKLGSKYIWRGIKLLIPIIIIIAFIIILSQMMGGLVSSMAPSSSEFSITSIISPLTDGLAGSPLNGEATIPVSASGISGQVDFSWGLKQGGYFLLFAGLIMIIAGFIEIFAKKTFFEPKMVDKKEKIKKDKKPKKNKAEDIKGMKLDSSKPEDEDL